ncbi:MAG: DUF1444 family protein [Planctomycetota bacterium]|nr:DUF1444 family protein [Planctomycetota bacterium]MDA1106415.1 DUF1444 family protein [Planctomycetota bacterium]
MRPVPLEPQPFTECVIRLVRRHWPARKAQSAGELRIVVDGRVLSLENLHRLVSQGSRPAREVIRTYFDRVFEGDLLASSDVPFAVARPRIMPRLQPESIFETVESTQIAHMPYVNGTVIVYVLDLPDMTVSISTEQVVRWGLELDELDGIARENLSRYAPELKLQVVESKDGGRAVVFNLRDGYDAARLLIGSLWRRLAPELKGNFLVAVPARDIFVAITENPPGFVDRIHDRVAEDYQRLPYPISKEFFLVTRDGVAGTAAA